MRQLETTVVSIYCTTLHHVNQPEAQQSGKSYEELARDNVCCVTREGNISSQSSFDLSSFL